MSMRSEPVLYVKIIPKGKKTGVRIDLTDRVLGWSFDDNESKSDKLVLSVDNWDLANFDTPVWSKGNILEFSFGYYGNMAPSRQMIIKKVTGSVKLNIEAYGKKFLLDREARCRTFFDVKRSDVATQLAEEHGFGSDARDIEDTENVLPSVTQAAITDAKLLRRMAAKEGYEFYIDFDGFHFHKRRVGQRASKTLIWYSDGTGTLLNFNIDNDISRIPSKKTSKGRDKLKKKDFQVIIDYAKDFSPTLAPTAEVVAASAAGASNILVTGFEASTEIFLGPARRKAKNKGAKKRQQTIKMKGNIVGDPLIFAKSVIRIEGIGKRLSGNYYVKSVKHSGGADYKGVIELIRDGHSEKKKQEVLFKGGAGFGGAKTCAGAISVLRRTIRAAIATRDAEYKSLAGKRTISGTAVVAAGSAIRNLRSIEQRLAKGSASKSALPVVREAINEGANLAAAGLVGSLTRTSRAGHQVQSAGRRAESACENDSNPLTNLIAPIADPTKDVLATGRVLSKAGVLVLTAKKVERDNQRAAQERQVYKWLGGRD